MVALVEPDDEEKYLLAILDSPDGIDLAEFAFHDPRNDDGCYRLYDYQWSWFASDDMYQIDQGGRNLGKELALDTPVPIPRGWTTMGDIRPGDVVFDEAGQPTTVTDVHPVRRNLDCYEVVFSDGAVIVASGRHRWLTWDKAVRKSAHRGGHVAPAVRTTSQIRDTLRVGKEFNHSIPVAGALQLSDASLELDPWVLGYWLGNGSSAAAYLCAGRDDLAYVEEKLASRNCKTKRLAVADQKAPMLRFDPADDNGTVLLAELCLLGDKHIPDQYLRASEVQRRELLAGIFDSDGHLTKQGHAEITLMNEGLARDVVALLLTLGEKPTLRSGRATIAGVDKGTKWRISWTPQICPAQMPRKAARFVGGKTTASSHRRIVDVRPAPSVPVRCISVDSPSHLYLVGDHMIPTHNTERIKLRAAAHPFYHPGKGRLLTAPELNHLRPLTDEVEKILLSTRLVREMMPTGKGAGIARQPHWQVRFRNGSTITSRLPNKDGKGVKGQHVVELEIDEAQDYPAAGWREVVETLNAGDPDARWCCHGVSRGVRDSFFEKTQPDSGWRVHRPMAMNRPTWSTEERKNKILEYGGSRQAVDYKRNIYGEHGDASNSVFVLAKLMAIVDLDEGSTYNSDVYTCIKLELERFPSGQATSDDERAALLHSWIDVPGEHFHGYNQRVGNTQVGAPHGYTAYWGGMDVGVTNHPSEILIFGQRTGSDFLELLTRVQMQRINVDDQMLVVARLFELYGDRLRFGIDKTGVGFGVWDPLTRRPFGDRVYGFGFSEKRVAGFEDRPLEAGETQKDLARLRNVVEASTDWLRNDYVDTKRFRLPYDREILIEFQGQTYITVRDTGDPYGVRRQYAGGSFHCVDEKTEILTAQGWRTYDHLVPGTPVLTLNMNSGVSHWSPLREVVVMDGPDAMIHSFSRAHDSLTTPQHRWPVRRYDHRTRRLTGLAWKTTDSLVRADCVPVAVPYGAAPIEAAYTDSFVELMAWFWTEGNCTKSNTIITQSSMSENNVESIRRALHKEFGAPAYSPHGLWHEYWSGNKCYFILDMAAGCLLRSLAPNRVVRPEFLLALTHEQLHLFIETSERGDGNHHPNSERRAFQHLRDKAQADMLEMACALAGIGTITRTYSRPQSSSGTSTTVTLVAKEYVRPAGFQAVVPYAGKVWCPRTEDGNWLARRNGTVYWTGNTLDAAKVAVATKHIPPLEALLDAKPAQAPVLDIFMGA